MSNRPRPDDWRTQLATLCTHYRNIIRTIHTAPIKEHQMTHNDKPNGEHDHDEMQDRIEHLEHALNIATLRGDQYKKLLTHYYGFDIDNTPELSPMNRLTRDLGSTITATFPGEPVEGPDGPVGMTATETITAPLVGIVLTAAEVIRDGVDPTLRGLTIVDHDGQIIRRNPLEED